MSLATNKIILANATSNTAGAYFLTTTISAVNTGNGTVVPAGVYILFPQANTSIIANNGSSNVTVLPANTGGVIISDVPSPSIFSADCIFIVSPNLSSTAAAGAASGVAPAFSMLLSGSLSEAPSGCSSVVGSVAGAGAIRTV